MEREACVAWRLLKWGVVVASVALLGACGVEASQDEALSEAQAQAVVVDQKGPAAVIPRQANFRGRSYEAWMDLYARWYFLDMFGLASGDVVDKVHFIGNLQPQPSEEEGVAYGTRSVTVRTGEALAVTCLYWAGERFFDGAEDQVFPREALGCDHLTVDGRPVDVTDFYVQRPFDPIMEYGGTTPWGSTAALFYQAYAFVLPPMSVGVHTIEEDISFPAAGLPRAHGVWTITVEHP